MYPLLLFSCTMMLIFIVSEAACDIEGEEGYLDFLEEMQGVRVDINEATMEELLRLPGVSPTMASNITETRKRIGRFRSTGDLVTYGLVSDALYKKIDPYITVKRKRSLDIGNISVRTRLVGKWSDDEGKKKDWGNYTRLKWEISKRWMTGIIAERDPGERLFADQWKWSVSYHNESGFLRRLAAGNIRLELARGLLFFSRSRVSRESQVIISAGRTGRGIGADLSASEEYCLKGFGLEIHLSTLLSLTTLVSSNTLDVSRDTSGRIVSISTSGYHYPSSSIDRDGVGLSTAMAHLDIAVGETKRIGFTLAELRYSEEISPPVKDNNYHAFRGERRDFAGFDWDIVLGDLGVFGEGGVEIGRGKGVILGVESGTRAARWNLLFRSYDPDFSPPFGNSFQSGSGNPTNERGFYSGLVLNASPDMRLSLFLDVYRRLWRGVRNPFPVKRGEMFVEGKWRPNKGIWLTLRFIERRAIRDESGDRVSKNGEDLKRKLRLQIDWTDKPLRFRGRYECVLSGSGSLSEDGALLYFDTRLRPVDYFSLDLRVVFFGAESGSSAVYSYEIDLPGVMRIVPLSGEGMRWYLHVRYSLRKDLRISVKYGDTGKVGEGEMGSNERGLMHDRTFGLQLDYTG